MKKIVMKKLALFLFLIPLMFVSCKKEPSSEAAAIACLDNQFEDYTIGRKDCIFYDVFYYKEEYWTVNYCCVCDMITMAVDCDGNSLCDFEDNCMKKFFKQAEFLFSFSTD